MVPLFVWIGSGGSASARSIRLRLDLLSALDPSGSVQHDLFVVASRRTQTHPIYRTGELGASPQRRSGRVPRPYPLFSFRSMCFGTDQVSGALTVSPNCAGVSFPQASRHRSTPKRRATATIAFLRRAVLACGSSRT